MEKKKLLFSIDSLGGGGAEKVLHTILMQLDYNKFEVHLFLITKSGVFVDKLPQTIKIHYIFVGDDFISGKYRLINKLFRATVSRLIFRWPFLLKIFSYKIPKVDKAVSFCEGYNTMMLGYNRRKFGVMIGWIHIDMSLHRPVARMNFLIDAFRKADELIFVSHEAKNNFSKWIKNTIPESFLKIIYNPINIQEVLDRAEPAAINETGVFTLISIGRLQKQKRFDRLIRVHKRLLDQGYKIRTIILGEGEDRPMLEKEIGILGIKDSFLLAGFKDNVYAWLNMADVFVMTSDYEGLPLVVCEAMILGKPILATNVTGPRELLGFGKYGMLVNTDDESIFSKLKEMIDDVKIREGYRQLLIKERNNFIFSNAFNEINNLLN